jgi:osmotically-inducible protein OsmY
VENEIQVKPPQEVRDNELTDLIRVVFDKDPLVRAEQLIVGTAGGVVEVRGLVRSDEERRLALNDVWYVPGVWDVVDRIQVQP